jgi:tight adherence protein C
VTASPLTPGLLASLAVALAVAGAATLRSVPPAERRLEVRREGRRSRRLEPFARRLGAWLLHRRGGHTRVALAARLDRAGRPLSPEVFAGYSSLATAAGLLIALELALGGSRVLALAAACAGTAGMHLWLSRRATERQRDIARQVPQLLDMVAVTVRGGVGYRRAVALAGEQLGGPLGDELARTQREIGLGASVREAFSSLRERNPVPALDSFVAAQLRAEELGVPLADALSDIAADVRRTAWQDARTQAARAVPQATAVSGLLGGAGVVVLMFAALVASLSDIPIGGLFK